MVGVRSPRQRRTHASVPDGRHALALVNHQVYVVAVPRIGGNALRGARVITMRGKEQIPDAEIIITDNRITALGPRGSVIVPEGARILDVNGMTIMPGIVDVHAHWFEIQRDVLDIETWPFLANLTHGVTTGRDPARCRSDWLCSGTGEHRGG